MRCAGYRLSFAIGMPQTQVSHSVPYTPHNAWLMLRRGNGCNRRDLLGNYNLFFRQSAIYLFSFAFRSYSSGNRQGNNTFFVRSM
jgi:hypothetical protein